ncbi:MAG: phosphatidate cytidylyltransferase [Bacteroidia bacterium]|nr:phosphatidate cytidylyltransferase [Bacteroidia bacterium]
MNRIIRIPDLELSYLLGVILGILILGTGIAALLRRRRPSDALDKIWQRAISWWWMTLPIIACVLLQDWFAVLFLAWLSYASTREFFSIAPVRGADRLALLIAYGSIPVQYGIAYQGRLLPLLGFIPLVIYATISYTLVLRQETQGIGRSMALIPGMIMLCVFYLSHAAALFPLAASLTPPASGIKLLMFLFLITEMNDVFQFFSGKLFGRHKILPIVSPNKTWEGFIGGIVLSTGFGAAMSFLLPLQAWQGAVVSACLAVAGFMGDTIISAIKRDLQIKDTGDIIPGHGGLLDRLDSLFLTAPAYYYLLNAFLGLL